MKLASVAAAMREEDCLPCALVAKASRDPRLVKARKAYTRGLKLQAAGRYGQAVPHVERALRLREAVLGPTHLEVAACLHLLGTLQLRQGNPAHAEAPLQRALSLWESAPRKDPPQVAGLLGSLATLYLEQGQYARAEPLYTRALGLQEAALGKSHPDVAGTLNNLAIVYRVQGQYARAEPLIARAIAIYEETRGKSHPEVALALNGLATLYLEQGRFERAEPLCVRALGIQERALGKNHPDVAGTLNNLAAVHRAHGQYARGEPLYLRALAILEAALGTSHPDVAMVLNNLAGLYIDQGQYARAEPLIERGLAIREAAFGPNHPEVADSLNRLASRHEKQGQYARAEALLERALSIWEAAFGPSHPKVSSALLGLALLNSSQGDDARARQLIERSLAIQQAVLGPHHPYVAVLLMCLADYHMSQGEDARAEPLIEQGLGILEKALGPNHHMVAMSLLVLAYLYECRGEDARAEPLMERALAIQEAALGKRHPEVALSLLMLAELRVNQGDDARARPLLERALAIQEAALGGTHPKVADALRLLAQVRLGQQQLDEALPLFQRALSASETHLRQEVFNFSEARLASVLLLMREEEELLYSLARAHPDEPRVRHLAFSATLLRKGRSVEELSATSRIIYRDLGPSGREAFLRLRALRTQLSTLSLAGPGELEPAEYQQRLKGLVKQGNALERELARRSESLRALHALPSPTELLDRVARALPKSGALVEFVAYCCRPRVSRPAPSGSRCPEELRYLALLLFPDGTTRTVDLGLAAPIDAAARRLRGALAGRAVAYEATAQELYTLAFRPLLPHLGTVQRLFLAPEGQLSLVPFAALHDGERFLVEAWDITYLTSGKDLLRRAEERPRAQSVVVLADPDFSAPAPPASPVTRDAGAERSVALEQFFSTLRAQLAAQAWPRLPGTQQEAKAIQHLFPQAQLLLGREASKEALLKLETPGVLHIATHGFFLEDASAPAVTRAVVQPTLLESGPVHRPPDPLLRSGLVLAGAAQAGARREDSLVTALELAGLNLWGTQLVVLSACDTGRGDVKLGQGVYGLRRALMVAGAETVVTSLWKVNDETTRELMEGYYQHLLAGKGRTTALREAMKELRKKKPHPYYWAPFIAIGQDGPLRGLVPASGVVAGT